MISYFIIKRVMLFTLLVYTCYTDIKFRKIYNNAIVYGLICGSVTSLVEFGLQGILNFLLCSLIMMACFIPMYLLRGMAAGDVKLCAVVGGMTTIESLFSIIVSIYITGGLMALVYVAYKRRIWALLKNLNMMLFFKLSRTEIRLSLDNSAGMKSVGRMPYAVAITIGTLLALYFK